MKKLNNKGLMTTTGIWVLSYMFLTVMWAGYDTAKNGELKKGFDVVTCKASGENAEVCNEKYDYTPRPKQQAVALTSSLLY